VLRTSTRSIDFAGRVRGFGFSSEERLKRSSDVRFVCKNGGYAAVSGAKLFFLPNKRENNRIAFTFPRKFGNAVERNRARRLSRESFRLLKGKLKQGYDFALLVFPSKTDTGLCGRMEQLERLFVKARLFREALN
jgi:ribonuclease P protein component